MTISVITPGRPHPLGWVPCRLLLGDELGDQPRINHFPPRNHNLEKLYRLSPQQIVDGNGVAFRSAEIDAWVMETGGVRLTNGQAVFSSASVIFLPPNGPRLPVAPTKPPASTGARIGIFALLALAGWALWE